MNREGIPEVLAQRPQWVCWRYDWRQKKWIKLPINPSTGTAASSTDPATWASLDTAWAYYLAHRDGAHPIAGIGYVFAEADPFCGIDLDDARDPSTGEPGAWALPILGLLDSYTEISPSGTGFKVWVAAKKPGEKCRKESEGGEIELYDCGRYFAVTGRRLSQYPATVEDRQAAVDRVYKHVIEGAALEAESPPPLPPPCQPPTTGGVPPDDTDLIDAAQRMLSNKFAALWRGDTSGHGGDDSRADLALCNHLAWLTGGDTGRVDRLFRLSGLMRPKWDERRGDRTYGEITVDRALADTSSYCSWDRSQQSAPGANSHSAPQPAVAEERWPAPLGEAAYHGPAGELVRTLEPATEADPVALLLQTLIGFGSIVGRDAFFVAEGDRHHPNEFGILVGRTAKGRKGSSWGRVRPILEDIDSTWAKNCINSGLSTGEGLIEQVRDPVEKREKVKGKGGATRYEEVVTDAGVEDKRLLVIESEYATVLRQGERSGNSLSGVLRLCWDGSQLRTMTRSSPLRATGSHISLIGHITADELSRYLTRTEIANGLGNRHLFACVQRSKLLPEGGEPDRYRLAEVSRKLTDAGKFARGVGEVKRDASAAALWREVYPSLSSETPGIAGALLARAEAHVMRLALIYALLDCSRVITEDHLSAALTLWKYCHDSVLHIFGGSLGDPLADDLLTLLRRSPKGVSRSEISSYLGRHSESGAIGAALSLLARHGLARVEQEQTGGRPVERWFAIHGG